MPGNLDPNALARAVEAAAAFEIAEGDLPGERRALAEMAAALIPYMEAGGDLYPTGPERRLLEDWRRAMADISLDEPQELLAASVEFIKANRTGMQRLAHSIPVPGSLKAGMGNGNFLSAAELRAAAGDAPGWIVGGLIPAGGTALLVGRPKAGKSTMARNGAVAVALGRDWLGRDCLQGPALYAAFEGSARAVIHHVAAMQAEDAPVRWYVGPPLPDPIEWLRAAILEHGARLAVVDPLFRFVGMADANDYAEATRATQPIIDLAAETGCAILMLHHARKGSGEGGDEALGSTGLFGAVDTLLSLKREGDRRSFYTIQREGEDTEETALRMDESREWIYPGQTRREQAQEAMREALSDAVERLGNPTHNQLLEAVDGRNAAKVAALNHLVETGAIDRTGTGRKGNPFRYSGTEIA